MKLSRMFNSLPKRLAAGAIVALAFAFPVVSMAAPTVKLEGSIGVANQTAGATTYGSSTNATYDQVVKVQVYYHNTELPDSGLNANNLKVKINIPTANGKTQTVSETTSADNSNTVTSSATVNLDGNDASLQYIPGTAVWRHDVGTNAQPNYVETKISDAVVTSGAGLVLEDEKPCYNFAATVTVEARVTVPGVSVVKQVRVLQAGAVFATENTANPGDTLQYKIAYGNTGNTEENNVVIRDNLPPNMTLIPGTTYLVNQTNPNGVLYKSDNITGSGIVIGNYASGANAYVVFEVKLDSADKLTCGATQLTNVGIAQPEGMGTFYNTAITNVNKVCTPSQTTPTYMCDLFHVTVGDNRTVTVDQFKQSTSNGATFKDVSVNWGDNSSPLLTNNVIGQTHQYGSDGTYNITATVHFTVNNADVSTVNNCVQAVSFSTPTTPGTPSTPSTPATPSAPTSLVNTGPGQVIGLFAAVSAASAFAYRLILSRKLAR